MDWKRSWAVSSPGFLSVRGIRWVRSEREGGARLDAL
jgi:hypothetical protein